MPALLATGLVLLFLLLGWQAWRAARSRAAVTALQRELDRRTFDLSQEVEARREAESRAREQAQECLDILDSAGDGYVLLCATGQIVQVNSTYCQLLGYGRDELVGRHMAEFKVGDHAEQVILERLAAVSQAGRQLRFDTRHRCRNGRVIDFEVVISRLPSRPLWCAFVRDMTERKQADEQQRLAAAVFTHANEGIMLTDARARILDVNAAYCRFTGYERHELIGQTPRLLQSGRHDRAFYARMRSHLAETGHWSGEVWNRRKSGEIYPQMLSIGTVPMAGNGSVAYVALATDITPQKRLQSELERLAHYDALTGLPNRLLLLDRLGQALLNSRRHLARVAVVFIDLDGFKAVNDEHGHAVGDALLRVVAERMRGQLRENDTLARLGGDEFVAVLVDLQDAASSLPLVERLCATAREPVQLEGVHLQVSASVGVALYPQSEAVDADQLLRQADQAMYQAKVAGRNRHVVFDPESERDMRSTHEALDDLRRALAAGEFELHYQPQVNLRQGRVVGVEALIRWRHPQRGLIGPSAFLPLVEAHPLAMDLDEWVLDAALDQLGQWRKAGIELDMSVNVSAHLLQRGDFVDWLRRVLGRHAGIDARRIRLEVVETARIEEFGRVASHMQACTGLGVRISIDDFGTGYSSLNYVKRMPVASLKIDRSFVSGMLDNGDDRAIVVTILALARSFGREVLAEGVETLEHGAALLRLGCELAQGYGIARPMPAADVPGWVNRWRVDPSWSSLTGRELQDAVD